MRAIFAPGEVMHGGSKDVPTKSSPLLSKEDYYFEGDLMVFTAAYHRKRGYCCGSGCRHCPYPNEPESGRRSTQLPVPEDPAAES